MVKLISENNREHYTREGNKLLLLLLLLLFYFSLQLICQQSMKIYL